MTGSATITLHGSVKALVNIANQPETAEIAVEAADQGHNVISIENTLIDESAHEVHLNPGAEVMITIKAEESVIRPLAP